MSHRRKDKKKASALLTSPPGAPHIALLCDYTGPSMVDRLPAEILRVIVAYATLAPGACLDGVTARDVAAISQTCRALRDAVDWHPLLASWRAWTWVGHAVPRCLWPVFAEAVRWGGAVSRGVALTLASPAAINHIPYTRRGLGMGRKVHLHPLASVMAAARREYPELRDYRAMVAAREAKALRTQTRAHDRQRRREEVRELLASLGDTKGTYMGLGKMLGYIRSGAWSLKAVADLARRCVAMAVEEDDGRTDDEEM
jgi:hypothetical protein